MILKLNNRDVEVDLEFDSENALISAAGFLDTGKECSEEEIEQLENDYADRLAWEWEEWQRGKAEDFYEGER